MAAKSNRRQMAEAADRITAEYETTTSPRPGKTVHDQVLNGRIPPRASDVKFAETAQKRLQAQGTSMDREITGTPPKSTGQKPWWDPDRRPTQNGANNALYWSNRLGSADTLGKGPADSMVSYGPTREARIAAPEPAKQRTAAGRGMDLALGVGNLALGAAVMRGKGLSKVFGGAMLLAGAGLTASAFSSSAKAETAKAAPPPPAPAATPPAAPKTGIDGLTIGLGGAASGLGGVLMASKGLGSKAAGAALIVGGAGAIIKGMSGSAKAEPAKATDSTKSAAEVPTKDTPMFHAVNHTVAAAQGAVAYMAGRGAAAMSDRLPPSRAGMALAVAGGALKAIGFLHGAANAGAAAVATGATVAGVKSMKDPLFQSPAPAAYIDNSAKSKAEAAPAPAPKRAAAAPEARASGPIEVAGYTRPDGTQVKGYTRQRGM